ncbi:MAG: hypothetical protein ACR2QC_00650 [Gammaproteobacteria bacterium]
MPDAITIKWIRAAIECDGCGKEFQVELDPSRPSIPNKAMCDAVEVAVADGDILGGGISGCSKQAGLALCSKCTARITEIGDVDYLPTDKEIIEVLDMAQTIDEDR